MTTGEAQNKAIVRRFYQAFEANNRAALDELLAAELLAYSPHTHGAETRAVHLAGIERFNAAFNEVHFAIEEQLAEADKVATRVTLRARHSGGDFLGLPPSGKQIAMSGISIERIQGGKIVERHVDSDWLGMMQQLGLVPSAQPAQ